MNSANFIFIKSGGAQRHINFSSLVTLGTRNLSILLIRPFRGNPRPVFQSRNSLIVLWLAIVNFMEDDPSCLHDKTNF